MARTLDKSAALYVAGARGLVGGALVRRLKAAGYSRILAPTHADLDLTDQRATDAYFLRERPEVVFVAAARVGGILANATYRADFIRENLLIQTHLIDAAYRNGVQRLLFLGSSCIYPRDCPQPMQEASLLSGPLEATNEPYAIAKIAGIKMCEAYNAQYGTRYLSVMPTNLYGPGDNFDLQSSHVLPALIAKFHLAQREGYPQVSVWGSGKPRREFLYVDDLADACVYLVEAGVETPLINIGTGEDLAICELAELIRDIVGYTGKIVYDPSKPDGTPRKLLDVSKMKNMGWSARTGLREGIEHTYQWFLSVSGS